MVSFRFVSLRLLSRTATETANRYRAAQRSAGRRFHHRDRVPPQDEGGFRARKLTLKVIARARIENITQQHSETFRSLDSHRFLNGSFELKRPSNSEQRNPPETGCSHRRQTSLHEPNNAAPLELEPWKTVSSHERLDRDRLRLGKQTLETAEASKMAS